MPKFPAKKSGKREAILDAMLDVVTERGFHEAPMSLIVERSGASAGVIYHYFASKDDIIEALFQRVNDLKRASFLEGYSTQMDPKKAFVHVMQNCYNFYRKHQREMRFYEQYKSAGFVCKTNPQPLDANGVDMMKRFSGRSKGGLLQDWPPEVIQEMTLSVIERLAVQPRKLSSAILTEITEKMWASIKA